MLDTYSPSGRFQPLFVAGAVIAALAMAIVSWLYQSLMTWIPFIYLNLLITAGFAALAYFVIQKLALLGRCRHPLLAALLGLVVGTAGWTGSFYFAYLQFLDDVTEEVLTNKEYNPDGQLTREEVRKNVEKEIGFAQFIDLRVEHGWTFGGSTSTSSSTGLALTGFFVYLFWIIEGGAILGAAAFGGWSASSMPYCEACEAWADVEDTLLTRTDLDEEALGQIQNATRLADVIEIQSQGNPPGEFALTYEIAHCPNCSDSSYMTIQKHWTVVKKKGEAQEKTKKLQSRLRVTPADCERLSEIDRSIPASEPQENADPAS